MEELIAAILLGEGEEVLLVYCMSEGTKGIFNKNYSSLVGRYLMNREMKLREFFRVSRDILQSMHFSSNSSL
jgi:hypothetical protein